MMGQRTRIHEDYPTRKDASDPLGPEARPKVHWGPPPTTPRTELFDPPAQAWRCHPEKWEFEP